MSCIAGGCGFLAATKSICSGDSTFLLSRGRRDAGRCRTGYFALFAQTLPALSCVSRALLQEDPHRNFPWLCA